jgi:hypothetical protein
MRATIAATFREEDLMSIPGMNRRTFIAALVCTFGLFASLGLSPCMSDRYARKIVI